MGAELTRDGVAFATAKRTGGWETSFLEAWSGGGEGQGYERSEQRLRGEAEVVVQKQVCVAGFAACPPALWPCVLILKRLREERKYSPGDTICVSGTLFTFLAAQNI